MKLANFYKKLTLANLLNWFAVRLSRLCNRFCTKLIIIAIYLDPNRSIFKKNLINLGYTRKNTFQKNAFYFCSVPEGCKKFGAKITFFNINQTVKLSLPHIINQDFKISPEYICEAKLPDTYVAELENVNIFRGTDIIIVKNACLYDEIDKNQKYIYGIKSPIINSIHKNQLIINYPQKTSITISHGIHFAKDHSKNYFHWIIECLPRLSLITDLNKAIPLLIDDDIPPQLLEALQLLNINQRKIIKLQPGISYKVKKLYYPSQLSVLHDNYSTPRYNKDIIYCPRAINFVRNSVLKGFNINSKITRRKIYISRKYSDYRQLLNSRQIEDLLVARGFEIVFPENLSFFAQVRIFSEAEFIISQSGAGMANLIFAPKTCKVLIMAGDVPNTNFQGFHALAEIVGINLEFLIGKSLILRKTYAIHSDFYIDTQLLLNYLDNISIKSKNI